MLVGQFAVHDRVNPEHLRALGVAVAFAVLALADGGYALELRSALTVVVWAVVLAGIWAGWFPRTLIPREALIAGSLLAGLALLAGASAAWGPDDGAAIVEALRVAGYLGLFALVVCCSPAESARVWLGGLALGIVLVAALALGSRLVPAFPGGDEQIASLLPAAQGRLSYPIGSWNALAAVCSLGLVLTAWLGVEASDRRGRALAVAAIPVLGLVLYLTSSRGGVVAAAVGLVALLALSARRVPLLSRLALGGSGAAALALFASRRSDLLDGLDTSTAQSQGLETLLATAVVVILVVIVGFRTDDRFQALRVSTSTARVAIGLAAVAVIAVLAISDPVERFDEFKAPPSDEAAELESSFNASHLASSSGNGRYQFWSEAVDAFGAEPVHGIGSGAFETYWNQNAPISRATRDAHSLFLETLAELGPLGLILVVGFLAMGPIAAVSRNLPRGRPEVAGALALFAAGATSAGIEVTWEIPVAFAPVVIAVGLLTGPAIAAADGESSPRQSRYPWGLATIVIGWIALILAADTFLAERSLDGSRAGVTDGDYAEATERANDAIALQPWAAEPRLQLALVHERFGNLSEARQEADEAIERAPEDWRPWLARARIETRDGAVSAGLASYQRARSLNPRAPLFAFPPATNPTTP